MIDLDQRFLFSSLLSLMQMFFGNPGFIPLIRVTLDASGENLIKVVWKYCRLIQDQWYNVIYGHHFQ